MADPGDVNLQHLSLSTDGVPIVITGTTAASPTDVHVNDGTGIDMVTIQVCNTDAGMLSGGIVIYSGSSADPTNVVAKFDVYPGTGAVVVLDGALVSGAKHVGVYCTTLSKLTAFGKAPKATL